MHTFGVSAKLHKKDLFVLDLASKEVSLGGFSFGAEDCPRANRQRNKHRTDVVQRFSAARVAMRQAGSGHRASPLSASVFSCVLARDEEQKASAIQSPLSCRGIKPLWKHQFLVKLEYLCM